MKDYTPARKSYYLGDRKDDGARIYISMSTWDCDWYWSFGYLGNSRRHYHLSSYQSVQRSFKTDEGWTVLTERRNKHMKDCLEDDYELAENIKGRLWEFCELALTAYALKQAAEVLGHGGSHTTTNPCAEIISMGCDEPARINQRVLPAIFKEFENICAGANVHEPVTA